MKVAARKVILNVVADIRIEDVYRYTGLRGEEAQRVADLIELAKLEPKWSGS